MFCTATTKTWEGLINMTGWLGNIQVAFKERSGTGLYLFILDMTMVNAWIIYKFVHANDKEIMSLLDFKRQVCVAYMKGADLKEATRRKLKLHLKLQTM